jgi:hypothetical protein
MAAKKGQQQRAYKQLSVKLSPRQYYRAQEAAIRAGFRGLASYVRVMIWRLTNEVMEEPPGDEG